MMHCVLSNSTCQHSKLLAGLYVSKGKSADMCLVFDHMGFLTDAAYP